MSNQSNPQEVKQYLLEQLNASKQAIHELSDDELEIVAGGVNKAEVKVAEEVVKKSGGGFKHIAMGAAASFFIPQLLGFGGSSSSQSQSTTTPTTTQGQ